MTDSVHPTIDELADLQAGLLDDTAADRVREHLGACAACADELARLDEVGDLLSEAATGVSTMPDDVVQRIDVALAAARDDAAGATPMPSLDAARARRESASKRRTPWLLIAGAAAAVVVFAAVGLDGMQGSNDGDDSAAGGSADSGGDSAQLQEGAQDSAGTSEPASPKEMRSAVRSATPQSLPALARQLAGGGDYGALRPSDRCEAVLPTASAALPHVQVRWDGHPAVMVVDPDTRSATVFGCGTPPQTLYVTSY